MIKAKHHFFIYPFFQWFTLRKMRKAFMKTNIIGTYIPENKPVLVLSNHISWWDGFWIMFLNLKLFHKKFHFMMLEEQLKKHWYFNYAGGFSIRKKSREIIESLQYTSDLLANKENMVLLFPQGELHSLYDGKITFEAGLERILRNTQEPIQIVFVANMPEYHNHSKPEIYMHINICNDYGAPPDLNTKYQEFYNRVLKYHLNLNRR